MAERDRSFIERLGQEYDLHGRTLRVILFSAVLYTSFLLLDKIYAPDKFRDFLIIRLIVDGG